MINLKGGRIYTTPYLHAEINNVFDPAFYERMCIAYPHEQDFLQMGTGYNKLSLSERNYPDTYMAVITNSDVWWSLYQHIKSDAFLRDVSWTFPGILTGSLHDYSARFEFSSMPANGGFIAPHTDIPSKVITLCIYMPTKTWEKSWGGGTDILTPNPGVVPVDYKTPLSDFTVARSTAYEPNSALLFIKSDNSWHSAGPFAGPAGEWRRSLTLNIERIGQQ